MASRNTATSINPIYHDALYPIGRKRGKYPATVSILPLAEPHGSQRIETNFSRNSRHFAAAPLHYLISILKLISRVNYQPRVRRRDIRERDGEGCHLRADTRENVSARIQDIAFRCGRKSNREKNLALYPCDTRCCPTYTNVIYKLCAPTFEYAAHFSSHASD